MGMMKAFTEQTAGVKEASTMETYDAVVKMYREHSHYIPLLERCVATHRRKEKDMYFESLGFKSADVPCNGTVLSNLFRGYPEVVNRVYSSRSSKGYVIVNVSEVERALGDIGAGKLVSGGQGTATRSELDRMISGWPNVSPHQTEFYLVYRVDHRNFCYIRLAQNIVELVPPLGTVRRMERTGDKVQIIKRRTGELDMVFHDPARLLTDRGWSHSAFSFMGRSLSECLYLIEQSYGYVKRR